MIYFDKLTKIYDDSTRALHDINLKIEPNEFISIVGHSGAGKTTLIKMLLAEERPSEGSVFFESIDINTLKKHEISKLRRRIGTVFQDFRLLPNKNVYENIAFAMEAAGRSDDEIKEDVPYVLEMVDLMHKAEGFPRELSGGEKQRVAIARAIVNQPDVIVADEPTGNLDPMSTYEIVQILKNINNMGTTVIMTTHNKGVVEEVGGRVITMESGKIVRDDSSGKYVL